MLLIHICLLTSFASISHVNSSYSIPKRKGMEDLYENILWDYKSEVRPVLKPTDVLNVTFGVYLIQLIDLDEKFQILTTNVWLEMSWFDKRLRWDPQEYENITKVHIPSRLIWVPDVVLENNAAGNPQITIFTDVTVMWSGIVKWNPPAIFKSFCDVDVQWFPYDEQNCRLKFMMWTHEANYVDLQFHPHLETTKGKDNDGDEMVYSPGGMALDYYYRSAEFNILNNTAVKHIKVYPSCCGPKTYCDITFYIHLRRMTLFYTVNLMVPCVLISFLIICVFYLPCDSGEKVTLCISILVTLSVFFLLLIDIMPATSTSIPMIGKYLLFDMILVSASIAITVITLHLFYRKPQHHEMPNWMRKVFLVKLAKWLGVKKPEPAEGGAETQNSTEEDINLQICEKALGQIQVETAQLGARIGINCERVHGATIQHMIKRTLANIQFISAYYKRIERLEDLSAEWNYLALVIDRLCLWIFTIVCFAGTCLIILQAPTLYDRTKPVEIDRPTKPIGYSSYSIESIVATQNNIN